MIPSASVVVPAYRSTTTLREIVDGVHQAFGATPHEVIFVDDGSPASTWSSIKVIVDEDPQVRGIRLVRNFGQHAALVAGIRAARFDVVVTMDDDLQNPPAEIPRLLDALTPDVDVVYGTQSSDSHDRWRSVSSRLTKAAFSGVMSDESIARMSTFRAFRTSLRGAFEAELGPGVSVDALLSWSTARYRFVTVEHHARADGNSNYTFRKLISYAIDIATGYSAKPLHVATNLGLATAAMGTVLLVWVVGRVVLYGTSVEGFAFLASVIIVFAGAQLVALGIIGEYLARIHFRVMRRPTYFVHEEIGGVS